MGDICISARNNAKHKPTAPMETQATTPPGTPQEQQGWYALKIFHNRAVAAEKDLQAIGVECYLPRVEVIVQSSTGRRSVRTRPAIAGLLFVCCPPARLKAIKEAMSGKAMFYPSPDGAALNTSPTTKGDTPWANACACSKARSKAPKATYAAYAATADSSSQSTAYAPWPHPTSPHVSSRNCPKQPNAETRPTSLKQTTAIFKPPKAQTLTPPSNNYALVYRRILSVHGQRNTDRYHHTPDTPHSIP